MVLETKLEHDFLRKQNMGGKVLWSYSVLSVSLDFNRGSGCFGGFERDFSATRMKMAVARMKIMIVAPMLTRATNFLYYKYSKQYEHYNLIDGKNIPNIIKSFNIVIVIILIF